MTKILGLDQSLSKCSFVLLLEGEFVEATLSKTGASKVKNKRKDTTYYDTLAEQIHHICLDLEYQVEHHNPDVIVFESLSYGSVGDASRNLAELHGAMRETLIRIDYKGIVTEYAPTSLKSYAHQFLKEDRKWEGKTKAGHPKKVKMDKKLVVEAARELFGQDFLTNLNYSTGLDDCCDATFLAHKYWSENCVDAKDVQNQ